jgi:hypothetical protein
MAMVPNAVWALSFFRLAQEQIGNQQIPQPAWSQRSVKPPPRYLQREPSGSTARPNLEETGRLEMHQSFWVPDDTLLRCDIQAYGSEHTNDTTATRAAKNTGSLVIVKP